MNEEDVDIVRAQRDADPERYRSFDPTDAFRRHHLDPRQKAQEKAQDDGAPASPRESVESAESAESVEMQPIAGAGAPMSRTQTQTERINTLESHPTALERIETHRGQHLTTVGSLRARSSRKPLPNFGAGKAYPPGLPEKEEYVVEFDGPDDPIHAQNWPMRRK